MLPSAKLFLLNLPKQRHQLEPSVQIPEPMGDHFSQPQPSQEIAAEGRVKNGAMDDPQGMSALSEKMGNPVMARKQEATVTERDGRRRGDLMRLWYMSMDNSGGLWLQDRCVSPALTSYL